MSTNFEQDKGEWIDAELWLEEKHKVPDGKFLLGVFTVGETGQMQLKNELIIWHKAKIIPMLEKYAKMKNMKYYEYNWSYGACDDKDFPEENDTPESLGWTSGGCAVISCILGEDFRKCVFSNAPRPVTHGKMSRRRQHFVARYVPHARSASDTPSASCSVPVCKNTWKKHA